MDTIIQAENISYKSGNRYLLNNINWTVKKGEHWVVFGLNGSGKTTLLSMIAGFKSPTAGTIRIFGDTYNKDTILQLRKKVGWVSSSFFDKYYKYESALQIVLSGLTGTFNVDGSITDHDVRLAKALFRELRIEEKLNYPFHILSKGERQNVLIARALISKPEILVLDEPGTGLDVYAREHMINTVRMLAENDNITVIYVTHYPEEIQPFMSKTMLLKNGKVFATGDTKTIFNSEIISDFMQHEVVVQKHIDGTMKLSTQAVSKLYQLCYEEECVK